MLICIEGLFVQNFKFIKNKKKVYLFIVAVELILFTGLRATDIGSDTEAYVHAIEMNRGISFNKIWNITDNPYGFEVGYLIFGKLCSYFNMNATTFLFFVSILIYIPFFKFVYEYSKDPVISILAYFTFSHFYYSLGIFRQMIALSICLMSLKYLRSRNLIKYCLIIALASSFHITAICWLPLYWLSICDMKKYKRKIIPIGLACIPLGKIIANVLLILIPRYEHYAGTERAIGGGSYLMLFLLFLLFLGCHWITKKSISREIEISFAALSLAIILQSVAYSFGLIGRAICYYTIFVTILLPEIVIRIFTPRSRKVAKILIGITLIILTIVTQFIGNKYICPFAFFWE